MGGVSSGNESTGGGRRAAIDAKAEGADRATAAVYCSPESRAETSFFVARSRDATMAAPAG